MKDTITIGEDRQLHSIVMLAEMEADAECNETWVDVLTLGDTFSLIDGDDRKAEFTDADFDEIIANHSKLMDIAGAPSVDANHATAMGANGEDTHLRAEIVDVRKADGKLQALFRWTAKGVSEIKDRAFRAISGEVAKIKDKRTGKGIGLALIGATLCNRPFMSGLAAPTTLAEAMARNLGGTVPQADTPAENEEDSEMDLIKMMSEAMGDTVTEDNAAELLTGLRVKADKADDLETEKATLLAETTTLKAEVETLKTSAAESTADAQKYAERIGKIEAELTAEREERVFSHDLERNAVSKAEAGTADEPGIARKIYRTDATLYSEGYGARADNHVTGNTTGHDRKPDKPAKDNTNAITEQSAAEVFLCEKADAYAEEHDGVNFTAALAKSVEALGTEGMRLRNLMYGKGA